MRSRNCLIVTVLVSIVPSTRAADLDLSSAVVVVRAGDLPAAEKIAPTVLTEGIARRTGLTWSVTDQWPAQATSIIALSAKSAPPMWSARVPPSALDSGALDQAEGYSIRV